MELKRNYKKTEDGGLIMNSGDVVHDYKEKMHIQKTLGELKQLGEKLGLDIVLPDVDLGFDPSDLPAVESVKVTRYSSSQNFTQKLINQGVKDGYISMSKGVITIHSIDGDLNYQIVREPGYYCCFDNKRLGDEKASKEYVALHFNDEQSPDKNNPAGYRKDNFFACELIKE